MATNEYNRNHPHGPPSLKMLDPEGRCLWCGDRVAMAALRTQLEEAQERIRALELVLRFRTAEHDQDHEQLEAMWASALTGAE